MNLQTQIPIIPLFAFPPPDSPVVNIPSSMNSDTNSDISVFHTISQFNNSDVETPDEFADSEPSPSTHTQTNSSAFSKPPFRPIQTSHPLPSLSTPSYASQVTPNYFPLIPTDHIITPQIIFKFLKKLTILLHCNNN